MPPAYDPGMSPAPAYGAPLYSSPVAAPGAAPVPYSGPVLGTPQPVTTYYQTPTYAAPGTPGTYDPTFGGLPGGGAVAPYTSDPWVNGGAMPFGAGASSGYGSPYGYSPYPGTAPGTYSFGLNGPQPHKFGVTHRFDSAFIHDAGTSLGVGSDFGVDEVNAEMEWVLPVLGNWVFSVAPQYNLRAYDGPFARQVSVGDAFAVPGGSLAAAPELPNLAHRFGLGLKLQTPQFGIFSLEGGFNPALATDFRGGVDSDAILYDAHAVLYGRLNPQFMFAVGAAYWDRVDDMIVPYAGVVWTPSDFLEFRLLFPKPRVSLFIGTPFGLPTWAYVQGEYHVEAYQVGFRGASAIDLSMGGLVSADELRAVGSTRAQLEDWRIVGGLYTEGPFWTAFVEAGAVLNREIKYAGPVRGFDANEAFIIRAGFRY